MGAAGLCGRCLGAVEKQVQGGCRHLQGVPACGCMQQTVGLLLENLENLYRIRSPGQGIN
jgi:hypothetical protein